MSIDPEIRKQLDLKLAKGEISAEEYDLKLRVLSGGDDSSKKAGEVDDGDHSNANRIASKEPSKKLEIEQVISESELTQEKPPKYQGLPPQNKKTSEAQYQKDTSLKTTECGSKSQRLNLLLDVVLSTILISAIPLGFISALTAVGIAIYRYYTNTAVGQDIITLYLIALSTSLILLAVWKIRTVFLSIITGLLILLITIFIPSTIYAWIARDDEAIKLFLLVFPMALFVITSWHLFQSFTRKKPIWMAKTNKPWCWILSILAISLVLTVLMMFYCRTSHSEVITAIAFSNDSKYLVSSGSDYYASIKIWDFATGKCLKTLRMRASSLATSPNGMYLASSNYHDNSIDIWRLPTGDHLRSLSGHKYGVTSVAFSHDGRYIISGGCDGTVKIWDAFTDLCMNTLVVDHKDEVAAAVFSIIQPDVFSVAFSPNDAYIVSGGEDKTIRIWETSNGTCCKTIQDDERIYYVDFSSDGREIISGGKSHIKMWDSTDGKLLKVIEHGQAIENANDVVLSPRDRFIAIASNDKIPVYNTSSGGMIFGLGRKQRRAHYCAVTFSPNGQFIVGSDYYTLCVWETSTGMLIKTLRSNAWGWFR